MPETVTIAGKPFPKTAVYGAGALTAGIVGYAWFTKGKAASAPITTQEPTLPEPVPVPTDSTDFGVTGGGPPPTTNAQWSNTALSNLIALGLDGPGVSAAIGKFLDHKPLSIMEQSWVQQAVAVAGNPPQGGPWLIIEAGPSANTPTPLAAPTGVRGIGYKNSFVLSWDPVPNATRYLVSYSDQSGVPYGATMVVGTEYRSIDNVPSGVHLLVVAAENNSGQRSPWTQATVNVL